ncbi:hypothetical protein [Sphingobium cloacae]|uniref:hypothetical protein n=1 Tax=Sphingobium cloacae TaxID=120107 RepID=UPI000834802D|nr:hypothetical protein [Sphingobium cloacae]
MIRTLIFGAIAGYVGKKLYDEGKLTAFRNDLAARYNETKAKAQRASEETLHSEPGSSSAASGPLPS